MFTCSNCKRTSKTIRKNKYLNNEFSCNKCFFEGLSTLTKSKRIFNWNSHWEKEVK